MTIDSTGRDTHERRRAADEPSGEDRPEQRLEGEIEKLSGDGKPAHPEIGPRRIVLLLVSFAAAILLVGLAVGIVFDATAGILIGALGLAFFLASPGFWATISRARERAEAKRRVGAEERER